jgi:Tfp pilus assembly protein PilP
MNHLKSFLNKHHHHYSELVGTTHTPGTAGRGTVSSSAGSSLQKRGMYIGLNPVEIL